MQLHFYHLHMDAKSPPKCQCNTIYTLPKNIPNTPKNANLLPNRQLFHISSLPLLLLLNSNLIQIPCCVKARAFTLPTNPSLPLRRPLARAAYTPATLASTIIPLRAYASFLRYRPHGWSRQRTRKDNLVIRVAVLDADRPDRGRGRLRREAIGV